jgi:hypothetical protein
MDNCKKSNRHDRKAKDKSKTNKYFGSKKHIRIKNEKLIKNLTLINKTS